MKYSSASLYPLAMSGPRFRTDEALYRWLTDCLADLERLKRQSEQTSDLRDELRLQLAYLLKCAEFVMELNIAGEYRRSHRSRVTAGAQPPKRRRVS